MLFNKYLYQTVLVTFFMAGCAAIDLDHEESDRVPSFGPAGFDVGQGSAPQSANAEEWGSRTRRRRAPATDPEFEQLRRQRAYADRDLIRGMGMSDVRNIWGEPTEVQVAGDERLGNLKWIYYKGLTSPWSIREARVIYFEDGHVAGWSTQ